MIFEQEGTFLDREQMGQDLPFKTIIEDIFIRKFMHGTWPEAFASMVIIKRHHNIIRITGIINRTIQVKYSWDLNVKTSLVLHGFPMVRYLSPNLLCILISIRVLCPRTLFKIN